MVSDATTVLVERFMPDGRLWRLPSRAAKREVVLRHVAQLFEAGEYWRSGGWVAGT